MTQGFPWGKVSCALFRLGFPSAPHLLVLNLPAAATRRTVLQKVRGCGLHLHGPLPQLVNTGFQVLFHSPPGVLFTFPSQYFSSIGHHSVFSLTGWSPLIPTRFLVSRGTLDPAACSCLSLTGLSPSPAGLPSSILLGACIAFAVRTPQCSHCGLGSSAFARHYLRNHFCFLFLRLLRCFSSPGPPRTTMDSWYGDRVFPGRVSPFRYLRLFGYLLLPAAFRSLSRLSSAYGAKASSLCSF